MPDGTIIRNVPEGTTRAQLQAKVAQSRKPTSTLQGVLEGFQPIAQNVDRVANAINPLTYLAEALGAPKAVDVRAAKDKKFQQLLAASPNRGSGLGKFIGEVLGTLPTAALPGGPIVQGAAAGGLMNRTGKAEDIATDMALGGAFGKLGEQAGKRIVAPIAERIGRTAPAQAVGRGMRKAVQTATGYAPKIPFAPKFTAADAGVRRASPKLDDVRKSLADAQRLGLPYALADASPELRTLAGSVSRKSPEARALAENTFGPRALGQADRATDAIDNYLAPITDLEQRSKDIRAAAQSASGSLYDEARAMPAPDDEALSELLRRPATKAALQDAYRIAQNEGRDPAQLGLVINDAGEVSLKDIAANEAGRFVRPAMVDPRSELTRQTVRGFNGSEVPKVGPIDLVGWVRQQGGLMNQGDELRHIGLNNAARNIDFAGQEQRFGPLVNDLGMNLDDAAHNAWEAGYFPELTERPDTNTFLNALRDTYEGRNRRFLPKDFDELDRFYATNLEREAMREARFNGAPMVQDTSIPAGPRDFAPVDVQEVQRPTFETLQLVKRGLDGRLNQYRNPMTGKLELEGNPEAQSIAGLVQQFNARLGELNPSYKAGNAAYAEQITRREALNLGNDLAANNVPQRQFDAGLQRFSGEMTRPEMQRGYATAMGDTVNRQRLSGNPYNAVYGSPLQQSKVGAMFPEGADNFGRQYALEGDMSRTAYETIGGSPTAARMQADQLFDAGSGAENALAMIASPKVAGLRLLAQKAGDHMATRGRERASAMAPTLFNTDPQIALAYLDDLARKEADLMARKKAYSGAAGLLGIPAAALAAGGN
jgi:hypothetical protein